MATKTNTEINGKKYFKITRTVGHEMKDGKSVPIKKQFYGTSKRNAELKYEEWKEAQKQASQSATDTLETFGELTAFYRDNVFVHSNQYAESTKELYCRSFLAFCIQDGTGLMGRQIRNVTAADIQLAYNSFDTYKSTMEAVHKFLKGFFKWAVLNKSVSNPLDGVTVPKKKYTPKKDGVEVWSDDDLHRVFECLGDHRLRLLIFLAYFTGMRLGELLGLKYSDIYDGFIHIRRQYHNGILCDPKYNSKRDIPINSTLLPEIERHKEWHMAEAKKNRYKAEHVFTTSTGRLVNPKNAYQSLARFYAANGIDGMSPHTYRATFCTDLCKAGVPLQTASKLMGHKSVNVTARFYTFVSDQQKIDAIEKLSI